MDKKIPIYVSGATGVMGSETVKELCRHLDRVELRLLVRPGRKNRRKMTPYKNLAGVTIIWGDMMNPSDVREALGEADYALHIGGMVSPVADHFPEKTLKVNTGAASILVDAIKATPNPDKVHLVYIGSVAQTSCRHEPHHWGRTGDPILSAPFDYYSVSKIKAERTVAESGLKHWVSLRQSGILHKGLIFNGSDPISFHVPLNGVLEWATVEDSARLMANICLEKLPENFWRNFYNIGSGKEFRLTNYEFEKLLLKALGCPPPEKVFEPGWFATRNFHGMWYTDSDKLEALLHFRENITAEAYFKRMAGEMPWWMGLTPLAPAFLIKRVMKGVAKTRGLGTLDWLGRTDCEQRIKAFFGDRSRQADIPGWDNFELHRPGDEPTPLDHGYDEAIPESELDLGVMRQAARFRGGDCISGSMKKGDLDTPLEWRCASGHQFRATPRTVLKGGHWCPDCMPAPWRYDSEARQNPFLAQVWLDSHSPDEDEVYG